ncbi:hypothetical protein [Sulfurimonas sp.]|uniref:hypothetical protein n=1 Tax=Sulfurimonas sp. TaxID=2022749 RepID=UPI00262243B9|nr:hypothetical protein [Sulfurimonas sp.]
MKNASDIINSIQNKPQFSKLSYYKCISRIQAIFSPPLQKMIKFAYIKNDTLFFVLNHPGAKQEFDNNIQSIKSALKFHNPEECKENSILDIKAFVTHTPDKPKEEYIIQTQHYKERANGNFSIAIKDEKLRELVQSIQKIIKDNHDT